MAYRMGRLGSISFDKMMQASKSFRVMSDKGAMRLAYELGKVHGENAKTAEAESKVALAQQRMRMREVNQRIRMTLEGSRKLLRKRQD